MHVHPLGLFPFDVDSYVNSRSYHGSVNAGSFSLFALLPTGGIRRMRWQPDVLRMDIKDNEQLEVATTKS